VVSSNGKVDFIDKVNRSGVGSYTVREESEKLLDVSVMYSSKRLKMVSESSPVCVRACVR